jgi:hypothetical protein
MRQFRTYLQIGGLAAAALTGVPASAQVQPTSFITADNASKYILKPTWMSKPKPKRRPDWVGPNASLRTSQIYKLKIEACGVDNARAIERLVAFLKTKSRNEFALAVVPGSSEGACHHCAWPQRKPKDPHWVEPNFRSRLRHAFLLLLEGVVHSVLISGGSIDKRHPAYNEAIYGFKEMVSEYGRRFAERVGGNLADRLIVDPWAIHSEVNVRNGDRLTRLLGLDRNVIVTEVGSMKRQGWWIVESGGSAIVWSFRATAKRKFGFEIGDFAELGKAPVFKRYAPKSVPDRLGVRPAQYLNSAGSHPEIEYIRSGSGAEAVDTAAIGHWNLRSLGELMQGGDARWDLGKRDKEFGRAVMLPPQLDRVGQACRTLSKR